jgi:adenylate kinase
VNLLLLGPQGSGKGTQATRISAEYGIPHVSTGDMFRAALANGSELGKRIKPLYEAGELIPDDLTVDLIEERLSKDDARDGFVLDGFPRNLAQAEALDRMLESIGRDLDAVLFFDVPVEVGRDRVAGRARTEGRSDDTPEALERRLAIYHEQTVPVVERYRATGKLVPLLAERPVNDVFAQIQDALEQVEAR